MLYSREALVGCSRVDPKTGKTSLPFIFESWLSLLYNIKAKKCDVCSLKLRTEKLLTCQTFFVAGDKAGTIGQKYCLGGGQFIKTHLYFATKMRKKPYQEKQISERSARSFYGKKEGSDYRYRDKLRFVSPLFFARRGTKSTR